CSQGMAGYLRMKNDSAIACSGKRASLLRRATNNKAAFKAALLFVARRSKLARFPLHAIAESFFIRR
ncbi:hypothetical protein QCD79_35090, partial [Pseudomonas quasicaspiana]|nr:hypothetical protein [Pseudomonas quasicaspiana]